MVNEPIVGTKRDRKRSVHTDNEHGRLSPILKVDGLLSALGPVLSAFMLAMGHTLWSPFAQRLFKALELLEHGVECENLPIVAIGSDTGDTVTSAKFSVNREVELNYVDLAIAINLDDFGGPDRSAVIQLDRLEPQATLESGGIFEEASDLGWTMLRVKLPRQREVITPVAVLQEELGDAIVVTLGEATVDCLCHGFRGLLGIELRTITGGVLGERQVDRTGHVLHRGCD